MKKFLGCFLCLMLVGFFVATGAQASSVTPDETLLLTSDHVTGGAGTPPFGKVELYQVGPDVDFFVTLFDDSKFVRTGAGDGMDFLFNANDIDLSTDFYGVGLTAEEGPFSHGGGTFQYGVYFTGQDWGGSNAMTGPIQFQIENSIIDDFMLDNGIGEIFVADILSGQTDNTGLVDASNPSNPVPEPATLLLLGGGLVGLAGFGRKKFKK